MSWPVRIHKYLTASGDQGREDFKVLWQTDNSSAKCLYNHRRRNVGLLHTLTDTLHPVQFSGRPRFSFYYPHYCSAHCDLLHRCACVHPSGSLSVLVGLREYMSVVDWAKGFFGPFHVLFVCDSFLLYKSFVALMCYGSLQRNASVADQETHCT